MFIQEAVRKGNAALAFDFRPEVGIGHRNLRDDGLAVLKDDHFPFLVFLAGNQMGLHIDIGIILVMRHDDLAGHGSILAENDSAAVAAVNVDVIMIDCCHFSSS